MPNFDVDFIKTDFGEYQKLVHNSNSSNNYQALCFIESSKIKKHISEVFDEKDISKLLEYNKKNLKRWKLRRKVNKIIPLLNKIKFSKFRL